MKATIAATVQWKGNNLREVTEFVEGRPIYALESREAQDGWERYERLVAEQGLTVKGERVAVNDFLVRHDDGSLHVCKPEEL